MLPLFSVHVVISIRGIWHVFYSYKTISLCSLWAYMRKSERCVAGWMLLAACTARSCSLFYICHASYHHILFAFAHAETQPLLESATSIHSSPDRAVQQQQEAADAALQVTSTFCSTYAPVRDPQAMSHPGGDMAMTTPKGGVFSYAIPDLEEEINDTHRTVRVNAYAYILHPYPI